MARDGYQRRTSEAGLTLAIDLASFQQRFTTAGITQSAVRLGKAGKGVTGMRSAARDFCSRLKLNELPEPTAYAAILNRWTDQLKGEFPTEGRHWGITRKCLNIFMRDASYNVHLRKIYPGLKPLEHVLEVPLDSYVAKGLFEEDGAIDFGLQRWNAVIRLSPKQNEQFQRWASIVAEQKGILRVHLDLLYFPFP
jgi:hypothetical protein